ncbi:hypothetical protein BH18ACI4_BH18ACI4_12990 [soil metagenome]
MKNTLRASLGLVAAVLLSVSSSFAQPQQQQATTPAPAFELYHIHVVKAAPGKLTQLIDVYRNGPAPEVNEPQVTPIILRHREGGEWDLIVITPLGKQTTISANPLPQATQDYNQRLQPLTDWHADTITVGPSWALVQKALVPAKDAQPVYQVSDYRSLSGHRQQLREVLDRNAQDTPGRSVLFSHAEGASWNFLTVTRYDSWAALGAPPPRPQAGAPQQDAGLAIREHMAVHHDTIAVYISGGEPIR